MPTPKAPSPTAFLHAPAAGGSRFLEEYLGNKAAEVIERKDGEALLVRAIGAPRMQTFIRASATHAITLTVKSSDFASYQELFSLR